MNPAVLVVDDDPFIRKLVAATLENVSQFDLHQAADGVEAVDLAQRTHPAVVFLDVEMPRMDGVAACRAIRTRSGGREMLIVMLTATGGNGLEHRAREAGADLLLTKPFSPLDLLRLVADLGGA